MGMPVTFSSVISENLPEMISDIMTNRSRAERSIMRCIFWMRSAPHLLLIC